MLPHFTMFLGNHRVRLEEPALFDGSQIDGILDTDVHCRSRVRIDCTNGRYALASLSHRDASSAGSATQESSRARHSAARSIASFSALPPGSREVAFSTKISICASDSLDRLRSIRWST
jgi:hypothetical protein